MKTPVVLACLLFLGVPVYAARSNDTAANPDVLALRANANELMPAPLPDDQHKPRGTKTPDVGVSGPAGSSAKAAWEVSDDDRIRMRFDPASVRERAAAHAADIGTQGSVHSQAMPSEQFRPAQQHVVDGSRNPELFLPAELLDVLLQGLHPDAKMRTPARVSLAKGIHEMGYVDDDFWNKLQRLSAPYLALKSRPSNMSIQRVRTPDGKVASFPIDVDRCVARHNLLQSARMTFGAEKFQRFLYSAVAPEVQRSDSTQQIDPAQELLFVARGCRQ